MEKIIREAAKGDSAAVWKIRNHPALRPWFNSTEEIDFNSHEEWFKNKYFQDKTNKCFILEIEGRVVGYCRFDLDGSVYAVSIALDHGSWGKGFGHLLLNKSLNKLKTNKEILATVKKKNESSLNLFKKNNFELDKKDEENFYLKYKKN